MLDIGTPELLMILLIVLLIFGAGRIGKVAAEIGGAVRAFRDGLKDNDAISDSMDDEKGNGRYLKFP